MGVGLFSAMESIQKFRLTGRLLLEDGKMFCGLYHGKVSDSLGEVVFQTSMTGYQEILTDPSYAGQIVVFTYPHIGNTGVNQEDIEAQIPRLTGMIARELIFEPSNWRCEDTLPHFLEKHGIPALSRVDTRSLTNHIRKHGSLKAILYDASHIDDQDARKRLEKFDGLDKLNLANDVATKSPYLWEKTTHPLFAHTRQPLKSTYSKHVHIVRKPVCSPLVVVYDFGVKRNILASLCERGNRVKVVPPGTLVEEVDELGADGVVLSNGPGNPATFVPILDTIRQIASKKIPILGVCFGHQIIALAFGARVRKMAFGHHGANHPILANVNKKVSISSQNHNYCVDRSSLPKDIEVTHHSLFDRTVQGIRHRVFPIIGFQGHPEGSPGPQDSHTIFDDYQHLLCREDHDIKIPLQKVKNTKAAPG